MRKLRKFERDYKYNIIETVKLDRSNLCVCCFKVLFVEKKQRAYLGNYIKLPLRCIFIIRQQMPSNCIIHFSIVLHKSQA